MRERHNNDNETETMIPIGLAALELLNRLRTKMALLDLMEGGEEKTEQSNERAEKIKDREQPDEQTRRYVERRLRDLREFERRARGE